MSNDELEKLKEKNEGLEQEVFEQKIKGVKGQLVAMGDTLHQRMNDIEEKNEIEFKHIKDGLLEIKGLASDTLGHAKATNGRVTDLEKKKIKEELLAELLEKKVDKLSKGTRAILFMHKYPVITTVVFIVAYLFSIKEIRDVVFNNFETLLKIIF